MVWPDNSVLLGDQSGSRGLQGCLVGWFESISSHVTTKIHIHPGQSELDLGHHAANRDLDAKLAGSPQCGLVGH